jgi:FMN reductase
MSPSLYAVGLSASPSGTSSRSGALLDVTLSLLAECGARVERYDLAALPSDGLLGRDRSPQVEAALSAVSRAHLLAVATPIYRATYTGLLKVFFDLLPTAALAGTIAIPIAAGGSPSHQLALDHGLRPLLASVGAVVVATGGAPDRTLVERLERAVHEARALAEPSWLATPSSSLAPELITHER